MSDILSAVSILLAILTALYGYWGGDFQKAAALEPETNRKKDHKASMATLEEQYWRRALPLTSYALLVLVIFFPTVYDILHGVWNFMAGSPGHGRVYDPVRAGIVAIYLGLAFLAAMVCRATCELGRTREKFQNLQ